MLGNGYRFKPAVTVTGNGYDCFSMFSPDFLRIATITWIATIITSHGILFITQMGIHFTFKHLFQYLDVQLFRNLLTSVSVLNWMMNSLLNTSSGTT